MKSKLSSTSNQPQPTAGSDPRQSFFFSNMEITDHSVGYFAVLIETVDEKQWSFYKAGHPTRARQLAMMRQETLKVLRVIMITKGQYETGLHNLKILDEQRRTSAKIECASRIELQRRRDRKKNSNRPRKPEQIA